MNQQINPQEHDTIDVLIVGAGPTGMTAATMLAQQGISCLLLDRHESVYPLPRAVHADDEIYRILARVGVGDEFAAHRRAYGYAAEDEPTELVNVRLTAVGAVRRPARDPRRTTGPRPWPGSAGSGTWGRSFHQGRKFALPLLRSFWFDSRWAAERWLWSRSNTSDSKSS